jgi:hypothetical protein
MIERWTGRLAHEGFRPTPRFRAGEETMLVRDRGPIRHAVWQTVDRYDTGRVRINLTLTIQDPFAEPHDAGGVHLFAALAEDRVVVEEYGQMRWWSRADESAAQDAMMAHGLPWLEERGRTQPLIARFEAQVREEEAPAESPGWLGRLFAGPPAPRPSAPRSLVSHYYLALLYYHAGDLAAACRHAASWLRVVESRPPPGEPERTRRQMAAMECGRLDTP